MNIFIAHWPVLADRKSYLDGFFKENSQHKPIYFCNFDKRQLSQKDIKRYYSGFDDFYLQESFNEINKFRPVTGTFGKLNDSEICATLNHLSIYDHIIKNKIQLSLILEDDCILPSNFDDKIETILYERPKDCDLLFLGAGGTSFNPEYFGTKIIFGQKYYKIPASRTVDAYLITWRGAYEIFSYFFWKKNFQLPIDWELNAAIVNRQINTYHYWPPLIFQGSSFSYYDSSVKNS